jgi:hypothetical protein
MFNSWYYSWAPWVAYTATTNPLVFKVVRAAVYPLVAILYAAYDAYSAVAPVSAEAGAIAAGIIAASLIGVVYVAPVAFVATRIVKRRSRIRFAWRISAASTAWFLLSLALCLVGYVTGSGETLAVGTSSMVLSALTLGSIVGTRALAYAQIPFSNAGYMALAYRRLAKNLQ